MPRTRASASARGEVDAVAAQLADAKRKLDNLYRAIEDGALDLSILAPRIRDVKSQVDELTAKQGALASASTPVVRLADDATIRRYVERLHATLATGSHNAQRAILRSWISRIEADGTVLRVTFTLPPDLPGGSSANEGQNPDRTEVLPRVANGGGGGSRTHGAGSPITMVVAVVCSSEPRSRRSMVRDGCGCLRSVELGQATKWPHGESGRRELLDREAPVEGHGEDPVHEVGLRPERDEHTADDLELLLSLIHI